MLTDDQKRHLAQWLRNRWAPSAAQIRIYEDTRSRSLDGLDEQALSDWWRDRRADMGEWSMWPCDLSTEGAKRQEWKLTPSDRQLLRALRIGAR